MNRFIAVSRNGYQEPLYLNIDHIEAFRRHTTKETRIFLDYYHPDESQEYVDVVETPMQILELVEALG